MKIKIVFLILVLLNVGFVFAQNDEEIVKQIRQQFKTINDEIKTYTTQSHDSTLEESGADQSITAFYKGKQLMKIEESYLGDMSESSNHYYFWNEQLIFVYTTNTYHAYIEGKEETTINENRYYFSSNKLIRWLDSEKKQKDKNSDDFKQNETTWINQAQKYLLEFKK